jgi:general stress protein YciG
VESARSPVVRNAEVLINPEAADAAGRTVEKRAAAVEDATEMAARGGAMDGGRRKTDWAGAMTLGEVKGVRSPPSLEGKLRLSELSESASKRRNERAIEVGVNGGTRWS